MRAGGFLVFPSRPCYNVGTILKGGLPLGSIHLFAARLEQGRAYELLSFAAARVWGCETLPPMTRSELGKPSFPDHPQWQFSLSHSGGLCLCALSSRPVGVDVEQVRPCRPGLPAYVMSEEELSAFDGSWEDFTRVWTLKEAYCKYLGQSIFPPKRLPVPPPVAHESYAGDGWRAAVCGEERPPVEIQWVEI